MEKIEEDGHFCRNCKFWYHTEKITGPLGFCRRYPPTVLMLGVEEHPPQPPAILGAPAIPGAMIPITQAFYPQTPPLTWCGEHQRRREPRGVPKVPA